MNLKLHAEDKYNWNMGQGVTIFGVEVPDSDLGRLNQVGIAQEYVLKGNTSYTIEWTEGMYGEDEISPPIGGGR